VPVPAMELHSKAVVVFNGNTVSEHKFTIHWVAIIWLIVGLYAYLYTLRKFRYHNQPVLVKVNKIKTVDVYMQRLYHLFE